ncbi:MAG: flagellar hook-length control protein FliK [Sphingopyxis sp.]|nr:flagellar hook-length control protein FliK [Sphingopyxis sp.]
MMNAPALPMATPAMPAGFAAFLANIGQMPADGGESAGFDQLLAAAPFNATAMAKAGPALPVGTSAPAADTAPADGVPVVAEPAIEGPVTTAPAGKAPAAKPDISGTMPAAEIAANLLIALSGAIPGNGPVGAKPAPATPTVDDGAEAADAGEAPVAGPAAGWTAIMAIAAPTVAPAATAKAAKPGETPAATADAGDRAPAMPVTARPRDAALPMPLLAGSEPPAARPAEAAPSMTVLFTPAPAQGTAQIADAAGPARIAERVLDMDSDGAWIDQLARDIAATKSDNGDISFRLMPRHLGRLDVAMRMGDEGMSLKLDAQHEAAATIVTAAQPRLVDDLRQQGVRVSGTEVTVTPGDAGRQSQGQGQGRAGATDTAHLIETATERAEPREQSRAADRRGRFA